MLISSKQTSKSVNNSSQTSCISAVKSHYYGKQAQQCLAVTNLIEIETNGVLSLQSHYNICMVCIMLDIRQ